MKRKASNPETSSQELHDILINSSTPEDWLELAKNPNTSLNDLEELSFYCPNEVIHNSIFELEYLANPNFLFENRREWLGFWHNNTIAEYPTWAIKSLCSNYFIWEYRIKLEKVNSKLPSIIISNVIESDSLSDLDIDDLLGKFVSKVDLNTVNKILNAKYWYKAIRSSLCPTDVIEYTYNTSRNNLPEMDYFTEWISRNPNTPQYILKQLYKETDLKGIRATILANSNCPLELVYAIDGKDRAEMTSLFSNTSEAIFNIAVSKEVNIQNFLFQIFKNPAAKIEHLISCLKQLDPVKHSGDKFSYKLVLNHPSCNTELLSAIFNYFDTGRLGMNELPYEWYLNSPHCTRELAKYLLKRMPGSIYHVKYYPEKYCNSVDKPLRIKAREVIMRGRNVF